MTDLQLEEIRAYRHQKRLAGCWGACFEVACFIEHHYGWRRVDGVYALPDGRPVFLHSWNVMPDGCLLDGTADQFGEGLDIALHSPGTPAFSRYREKYSAAHNPHQTSWLGTRAYIGMSDQTFWDRQEAGKALFPGWWLTDRSDYLVWFRNGAAIYPMFATMRERYRDRGYDIAGLE
jgi:hypothetical protein